MEKLQGWVFTYNSYSKVWMCATRENYSLLFNDFTNKKVLRSRNLNTLIELVIKTEGNESKLKKLIK